MILVDSLAHLRSVRPGRCPVPYSRLHFAGADAARSYLVRHWSSTFFRHVIATELLAATGQSAVLGDHSTDLLTVAAQSLARRTIQIAAALPKATDLTFDAGLPGLGFHLGSVQFDEPEIALTALRGPLGGDANSATFSRALLSPACARLLGPGDAARNAALQDAARDTMLVGLLVRKHLVLTKISLLGHRFALTWAQSQSSAEAMATEAPAPRPRRPATTAAHRSFAPPPSLPIAPTSKSPQALALIAAAQSGVPFCEECARQDTHKALEDA